MSKLTKLFVSIIAIVVIAGGMWLVLGKVDKHHAAESQAQESQPERLKRVRIQEVSENAVEMKFRFPGVARAAEHARLTFLISGTLAELSVKLGEHVKKGQVLARLYNPQLLPTRDAARERVRELQTRLSQVQRDLVRVTQLRESGAASKQELEQIQSEQSALKAGLSAAQAQYAESQKVLAEAELIAPFDATVDDILIESGEFVAAGQPVMSLSGGGGLEVETQVPELMLSRLKAAQDVTVEFPYLKGVQLNGTLIELGQGSITRGQLFPAVVSLPDHPQVRPGMTAELVFVHVAKDQLSVPVQAVVDPGSGNGRVFRYNDGVVERVSVEVVSVQGASVAVRSTLNPGDRVVVAGQGALLDGEAVEVVR